MLCDTHTHVYLVTEDTYFIKEHVQPGLENSDIKANFANSFTNSTQTWLHAEMRCQGREVSLEKLYPLSFVCVKGPH